MSKRIIVNRPDFRHVKPKRLPTIQTPMAENELIMLDECVTHRSPRKTWGGGLMQGCECGEYIIQWSVPLEVTEK